MCSVGTYICTYICTHVSNVGVSANFEYTAGNRKHLAGNEIKAVFNADTHTQADD